MSEHPTPNETVFLPGYEFMQYGCYIIALSFGLAMFRNRSLTANFETNWLEAFVALNGVAIFISPLSALFFKFISQVITNANT
ncbi:MAG: hypothetical protein HOP06_04780 [Methylotenera sp.]|nr:hypothetical protein [Methylotenera sp.]